ncbi:hypothetical protein PORCRE_999 [Porphyromonas crevioricanis JCM 15906]|uniref:Uncharacterized protein n=1 Tax=Porphyromonas crevioricanis JCM 15906 TaxID=1305617 RepID=T1DSJ8_9PORP|nr:hypothetical protein PORCRE_999 [Porphyromonas crevioricanis JCM 15906]
MISIPLNKREHTLALRATAPTKRIGGNKMSTFAFVDCLFLFLIVRIDRL